MINLNKPLKAKIFDFDPSYYEPDYDEARQPLDYLIWEVEAIYFKTIYDPVQIRCRNGAISKSFELLEQEAGAECDKSK